MKNKFGEVKVVVCSSLGQIVGSFWWIKECLPMLQLLNSSKRGYYFKWDELDALPIQNIVDVPMVKLSESLRRELSTILWNDGKAY